MNHHHIKALAAFTLGTIVLHVGSINLYAKDPRSILDFASGFYCIICGVRETLRAYKDWQ